MRWLIYTSEGFPLRNCRADFTPIPGDTIRLGDFPARDYDPDYRPDFTYTINRVSDYVPRPYDRKVYRGVLFCTLVDSAQPFLTSMEHA